MTDMLPWCNSLSLSLWQTVHRPDQDATHNPKWQGNALAGACSDAGDHIVFFPTGEVLQQACAFYKSSDPDGRSVTSNKVETGTAIRQFAVMGRSVAYQPIAAQEIFVAARGSANCTILQAPMHPGAKMKAKLKLTFSDMLYNVAASPHAEAELAFVTADGVLHWWEPESGLQTMHLESAMTSERLLRCEYSRYTLTRLLKGIAQVHNILPNPFPFVCLTLQPPVRPVDSESIHCTIG